MDKKPVRGTSEEGGRAQLREGADAEGEGHASVEARVRLKMSAGEPLSEEERRFLATLPADREVTPREAQER